MRYTVDTLFNQILGLEVACTSDKDEYAAHNGIKVQYTSSRIADGLFFQSSQILFETGIMEQNISMFTHETVPCFFSVGKDSVLPFDPFAASFYLISRYEEYLPYIKDQHGRFPAGESIAFKHGFLTRPLVNEYALKVADLLKQQYPNLAIPENTYTFTSTIDIDNAFAYKHKGFVRTIGGLLKGIKDGSLGQRLRVLMGKEKDPYYTFDVQRELHEKHNVSPIYFFLLGDYGVNDKNVPVKNKHFQSLIKSLADYHEVGIHPSYASNNSTAQLQKEVERLRSIALRSVSKSRQHFLRLSLPDTYRNLIDLDIQEEYTMGYAEQPGFRASICTPYYFYDLDSEMTTKLRLVPFAVMEATFKYYLELSPQEAWEHISPILQQVKDVKGTFVSVWHNESLCEQNEWKGWSWLYEKLLQEA